MVERKVEDFIVRRFHSPGIDKLILNIIVFTEYNNESNGFY